MSGELSHDEAVELLPLYVLGTLSAEEMLAVAAYVEAHPELEERLTALEEVSAQLAYAAPLAPLPAGSKERLMQKVYADARQGTLSEAAPTITHRAAVAPRPERRRLSWLEWLFGRNPWPLATGLAWLIVLVVGLYAIQLQRWLTDAQEQLAQHDTELTDLREANEQLQRDMTSLRTANEQLQTELNTLQLTNEQLLQRIRENEIQQALLINAERSVALGGTEAAPQARGAFYLSGDQGVFVLRGLEPLPAGQTYQLWLVPPGGTAPDAVSVGLLPAGEDEIATVTVPVPADLRDFAIVDVSVEPVGGSPHLLGPVVLRGIANQ
jgi:anti-sigma-K factor RskA